MLFIGVKCNCSANKAVLASCTPLTYLLSLPHTTPLYASAPIVDSIFSIHIPARLLITAVLPASLTQQHDLTAILSHQFLILIEDINIKYST